MYLQIKIKINAVNYTESKFLYFLLIILNKRIDKRLRKNVGINPLGFSLIYMYIASIRNAEHERSAINRIFYP